jgi:hypothetical protein
VSANDLIQVIKLVILYQVENVLCGLTVNLIDVPAPLTKLSIVSLNRL